MEFEPQVLPSVEVRKTRELVEVHGHLWPRWREEIPESESVSSAAVLVLCLWFFSLSLLSFLLPWNYLS